ncbi:MAG TPA: hypothetical protein EYO34_04815 [Candidatus Marinimicrobia bacterium]|nr:hypothetical protein [Candidatus Neomarinimicrobiota bacterium]HIB70845.1 hypothetical protein [Candidatus Neomarinimicrobiota bacterium]HIN62775.1 hypothetical protein [Candidatus Neomarinimicrobiota bacterium]HIO36185.1 hypothetical protein [Candidatus Neomarinimicrobiota bacterium]HIO89957.1 hypothetical protein [Candidatus Neomarinimicrobiota bacterium]
MRSKLLLISIVYLSAVSGQPASEVYLFDLKEVNNHFSVSNPVNISSNRGYDNQPSFMTNGREVLFTSTRNGQTDIVRYNMRINRKTWLTETEGSEYSPIQIGSTQTFSAILLEKDGTQLLYKYNMRSGEGEVLVPDLKIGYHSWVDKNRLISFVLGDPPTLQSSDLKRGTNTVLDNTIGRSLHAVPGREVMSYVSKKEKQWTINSFHPETGKIGYIGMTHKESDDYAWTPSGKLLTGEGARLYKLDPEKEQHWTEIADLSDFGLTGITRLAVSPRGDKIAVVVVEEVCRPSVVYLIRHAEKMIIPGEDDPDLTSEGFERAEALALAMSTIEAGAVYSSQYKRTQQTVAPLTKAWSVEAVVISADDPEKQIDVLFKNNCDQNVVIAGHSNTLPGLIELLVIPEKITIEDDQYGDLYVVRWKDGIPTLTVDHVGN